MKVKDNIPLIITTLLSVLFIWFISWDFAQFLILASEQ